MQNNLPGTELILHDKIAVSRTPVLKEQRATIHDKVPALTKTIAIIRCLNTVSTTGASLHEIAERLQITKSHCHNILKALTREGWLAYDDKRRSYSLAPRLLTDVSCLIRARRAPHLLIHEELARLRERPARPASFRGSSGMAASSLSTRRRKPQS